MALKLVSHRLLLIKTFKNSLQFQNILNVSRQVDFETRYRHLSTTKRIIQAPCTALSPQIKDYFDYPQSAKEKVNPILQSLELYLDFVDEQEELELLSQIDKTIGRRRYEDSHWDYVSEGHHNAARH